MLSFRLSTSQSITGNIEKMRGKQPMATKITCIAPVGDRCGEGVLWNEAESALYWTDINRFLIHRLDVTRGVVHEWYFDEPVVAISLTTNAETFLVALGSRLILWQPRTDARIDQGFTLNEWPKMRLNDGRADPNGNFWVGSMRNNVNPDGSLGTAGGSDGKLYKIAATGDSSIWREAVGISNTLCWSPDCRRFYFGDSLANTIYSYDFDLERGVISHERPFFTGFDRGIPDGSAIDSEGFLWNCRFGGGCIVRIAPDGQIDRIIELPILNPTTCTFGGHGLQKLFVTSASILTDPGDRLAGGLFQIEVEVPGLPERCFHYHDVRRFASST